MKGPPGKVKTTINPIKTITPRFITKALENSKKLNNFYNVMFFFTKRNFKTVLIIKIFVVNNFCFFS